MYGMVNEGIKSFIVKNYGEEKWREITTLANLKDDDFILLQIYSDKLTYDLVGSISQVLNITPAQTMEAYGRYWINFAAGAGYENLLLMFGDDFRSCLHNLNHMHEHMGSYMTGIIAPAFHVVEETDTEIKVDYFSKREGLTPFVLGLMYGLLDRYQQKGEVEYLGPFGDGHRFKIKFL